MCAGVPINDVVHPTMQAAAVCVAIPEPSEAFRGFLIDEMCRQSTSAMMNGTGENQYLD